jgi:hypothetical protein
MSMSYGYDAAMRKGCNYPLRALARSGALGLRHRMAVLHSMVAIHGDIYGEVRYSASPLILRHPATGALFHA